MKKVMFLSLSCISAFLLCGIVGSNNLDAASKSKNEKYSKFIPKGTYTCKKLEVEWYKGAKSYLATFKINGHKVEIDTVVDIDTRSDTIFEIGDQFIFVDGKITSDFTTWEYGTYEKNACMAHFYTDCAVFTTDKKSIFIVK